MGGTKNPFPVFPTSPFLLEYMVKPKQVIIKPKKENAFNEKLKNTIPPNIPVPPQKSKWEEPPEESGGSRNSQAFDPITKTLGCSGFMSNMIWDWFRFSDYGQMNRLSVHRFYKEMNLALDIKLRAEDQIYVALKKKLLADHGILYFHLLDDEDFNRMMQELELH